MSVAFLTHIRNFSLSGRLPFGSRLDLSQISFVCLVAWFAWTGLIRLGCLPHLSGQDLSFTCHFIANFHYFYTIFPVLFNKFSSNFLVEVRLERHMCRITGCGSPSLKLCICNAASSWNKSPSLDSQWHSTLWDICPKSLYLYLTTSTLGLISSVLKWLISSPQFMSSVHILKSSVLVRFRIHISGAW